MTRLMFGFMCVLALGAMPLVGCSETAGDGGSGGSAGIGGMGGAGGTGGADLCEGVECNDFNQCTMDTCEKGVCDATPVADGTLCDDRNACTMNTCDRGLCGSAPVADGTTCDDRNECTANGVCADGICDATPVADGTPCGDSAGACQQGSCRVACSEQGIRDAIAAGGGPYTFDCDGPTTIATEATISIDNDVQLDGEGNILLESPDILGGPPGHSLLDVVEGGNAALRGIALHGGIQIVNDGSLLLANVSVSGVGAPKTGGAIISSGQLTVVDSEVLRNKAVTGTDITSRGKLTLIGSTVQAVQAYGRDLIVDSLVVRRLKAGGETDVVNSTLGQVTNYAGRITIVNSTLTTGRIYRDEVPAIQGNEQTSIRGSVIIGHCDPEVVSNGYNIESFGDTCGFDQPTDQVNVYTADLKLGELADNGGPTETHALLPGSVAIDVIPAEDCVDADGEPLTTDQRGVERPQGDACDVGAVEMEVTP
jgi:hypothetical protein